MNKRFTWAIGVMISLAVAPLGRPNTPPCPAGGSECSMKQLEDGKYCKKCDKLLLEKADFEDDGDCKKCGRKPAKVKICIKKDGDKVDRARVAYKCAGCQESGPTEKDVKHKGDCAKKEPKPYCTKSGTKPHDE